MLYNIGKREGLRAIGSFPGQSLYYVAYEILNQTLSDKIKKSQISSCLNNHAIDFASNSAAGLLAEATSAFCYVPSDIISQKLQVTKELGQNFKTYANTRDIYLTEGWKGFYRGYIPYFIAFGPGSAVWWASYELFKKSLYSGWHFLQNKTGWPIADSPSISRYFNPLISGAMAGTCAVLVTNPLDVARTRIQLLQYDSLKDRNSLKKGFFNMIGEIYRKEGIRGMYKGAKPRIYVSVPGSSVAFIGYEALKEICIKNT
ncbi:mitochondrial carrier [Rozella allomycis CSF55]|uniref:Mitochondrial carrier n=1 Tax=Rozella allomycis (strain CSF55) TaxID=988480 RepID=A0A075ANZ8_ROZAC|nr:Mitochondrial substrate/solute carrier domain-containing protein [Rozella allomycis CSF55]RKP18881.1 mitochondrial carrier [Rozella allomycis CSF55]|eukprot:EPZ31720.1 Mitochondrial substrate/solute carrier domain-containing protein [Rozella allomycis CSF55]